MLASLFAVPFESDPCMPEFPSSSRAFEVDRPDKPLKSSLYCLHDDESGRDSIDEIDWGVRGNSKIEKGEEKICYKNVRNFAVG